MISITLVGPTPVLHSAPLLKMADAIATGDDAILEDPLLQDSLIRAKKLHNDGTK